MAVGLSWLRPQLLDACPTRLGLSFYAGSCGIRAHIGAAAATFSAPCRGAARSISQEEDDGMHEGDLSSERLALLYASSRAFSALITFDELLSSIIARTKEVLIGRELCP